MHRSNLDSQSDSQVDDQNNQNDDNNHETGNVSDNNIDNQETGNVGDQDELLDNGAIDDAEFSSPYNRKNCNIRMKDPVYLEHAERLRALWDSMYEVVSKLDQNRYTIRHNNYYYSGPYGILQNMDHCREHADKMYLSNCDGEYHTRLTCEQNACFGFFSRKSTTAYSIDDANAIVAKARITDKLQCKLKETQDDIYYIVCENDSIEIGNDESRYLPKINTFENEAYDEKTCTSVLRNNNDKSGDNLYSNTKYKLDSDNGTDCKSDNGSDVEFVESWTGKKINKTDVQNQIRQIIRLLSGMSFFQEDHELYNKKFVEDTMDMVKTHQDSTYGTLTRNQHVIFKTTGHIYDADRAREIVCNVIYLYKKNKRLVSTLAALNEIMTHDFESKKNNGPIFTLAYD